MILAIIFGALCVVGIGALVIWANSGPLGWQDRGGFHYGDWLDDDSFDH